MAQASPAAVERAIQSIRNFYDDGMQSLRDDGERRAYGTVTRQGRSTTPQQRSRNEMMRRARLFAELYSEAELEELCDMCRRYASPIGTTHIVSFLTVPRAQRERLQRDAIKGHWSKRQLDAAIVQQCRRIRSTAGRRFHAPKDAGEAVYLAYRACDHWQRMYQALQREPQGEDQAPVWDQLTPAVRRQIEKADRVITPLRAMMLQRLQMPRAGRSDEP